MKKILIFITIIAILISAMSLTGCKRIEIGAEGGSTITRTYDFTDFTVVEVGYAFKLEITPADTYSINISAGEKLFDHIKVTQQGSKLEIGLDRPFLHFGRSPRVKITMPELTGLHLSGASEGNVTGFKTAEDFDLTLSGASELYIELETGALECELSGASEVTGSLKATKTSFDLSGASEIQLTGSGDDIRIDASGASQVNLANFTVNDADIDFSGASDGSLHINGRLNVNLSGGSVLEYSGNPTLGFFDISGGSELEKR